MACNEVCLPNLANFTASDQKITVDSYNPQLTVQLRQQQALRQTARSEHGFLRGNTAPSPSRSVPATEMIIVALPA
jgi:hypothetical protein